MKCNKEIRPAPREQPTPESSKLRTAMEDELLHLLRIEAIDCIKISVEQIVNRLMTHIDTQHVRSPDSSLVEKLEAAKVKVTPSNYLPDIRIQGQNEGIEIAIAIVRQHYGSGAVQSAAERQQARASAPVGLRPAQEGDAPIPESAPAILQQGEIWDNNYAGDVPGRKDGVESGSQNSPAPSTLWLMRVDKDVMDEMMTKEVYGFPSAYNFSDGKCSVWPLPLGNHSESLHRSTEPVSSDPYDKIEDIIAEFGENPAECLGIIDEYIGLARHNNKHGVQNHVD